MSTNSATSHRSPRLRRAALLRITFLRVTLLFLLALGQSSAHAAWLRAESTHVVVYGDSGEDRVRAFTRKLERFHATLELIMPRADVGARPKLTVYMVRSRSDLQEALPDAPDDLAGLYSASADAVHAIAIARRAGAREGDDTLLHEYTHHFMMEGARSSYPTWFIEGFAEYYSTADVDGERVTVGKPSQNQLGTLSYLPWIDFDEVLTGSPWAMPPRKRAAFYAQSWLLTHYLRRDQARWATTVAYFKALRTGMSAGDAWTKHVGISVDGLRAELTRYADRNMQYSILTTPLAEPSISITALPKSADKLMLPAIGIAFGSATESSISALRAGLASFPGDVFAIDLAARAEIAAGNAQRAVELTRPLVREGATAEQLYVAGMAALALAQARSESDNAPSDAGENDYADAANLFVRTVRTDPMHFRALYRYWQIRARSGEVPDQRLQDVLVQAYNLAPQAKEIAMAAGLMLLDVERAKEARELLAAIAGDPHGEGAGSVARRLVQLVDSMPNGRSPTQQEIGAALSSKSDATDTKRPPPEEGVRVPPQPNEA